MQKTMYIYIIQKSMLYLRGKKSVVKLNRPLEFQKYVSTMTLRLKTKYASQRALTIQLKPLVVQTGKLKLETTQGHVTHQSPVMAFITFVSPSKAS